jgi:prevent-host-death family protein
VNQVDLNVAKTTLPELIEEVQQGKHIVITKNARPVAEIIPIAAEETKGKATFGSAKGMIHMADDFDAPGAEVEESGRPPRDNLTGLSTMTSRDKQIIEAFAASIREASPEAQVWAFGSRVRGDARSDSDYDMCVVIEHLDDESDSRISDIAFDVGWEYQALITTVTYSREQFERGPHSFSPLVLNVLREGVSV